MKRLFFGILALAILFGFNGCSDNKTEEVPVKIEAKLLMTNMLGFEQKIPIVEIISIADTVTIKNIIANNGNCKMTAHRQQAFPQTIKYGQKATAGYTANCNLMKVEVVTEQGTWSKEFNYIPEQYSQF